MNREPGNKDWSKYLQILTNKLKKNPTVTSVSLNSVKNLWIISAWHVHFTGDL